MISGTMTKSNIFSKVVLALLFVSFLLPTVVGAQTSTDLSTAATYLGTTTTDLTARGVTDNDAKFINSYATSLSKDTEKSSIVNSINNYINSTGVDKSEFKTSMENQIEARADLAEEQARAESDRALLGFGKSINSFIDSIFTGIAKFLIWLGGSILYVGGSLFEFIFDETLLKMSTYIEEIEAIKVTWHAFRDIANLVFIFVLLAIAVGFILDYQPLGSKKLLARLIIIAILLNFSFFFTGIVIDTSNILAVSFYEKLEIEGEDGIYGAFTQKLYLNGLFAPAPSNEAAEKAMKKISGDNVAKLVFGLLAFVLLGMVGVIFFVAAFMFLTRFIVLLIVLMLSPIAFVSWILPKFDGIWKSWSNALVGQAFFAPVFLIMIWVVFNVMGEGLTWNDVKYDGEVKDGMPTYAELVTGPKDASPLMGLVLNFLIVMGLAIASLVIAKKVSASAGSGVGTLNKYITSGGIGISGWGLRRTAGRAGKALAESQTLHDRAKKGGFGGWSARVGIASGVAAKRGSWDLRNASGFKGVAAATGLTDKDVGKAGGKGGYDQVLKNYAEKKEAVAKSLGKADASTEKATEKVAKAKLDRVVGEEEVAKKELEKAKTGLQRAKDGGDAGAKQAAQKRLADTQEQLRLVNQRKVDATRTVAVAGQKVKERESSRQTQYAERLKGKEKRSFLNPNKYIRFIAGTNNRRNAAADQINKTINKSDLDKAKETIEAAVKAANKPAEKSGDE